MMASMVVHLYFALACLFAATAFNLRPKQFAVSKTSKVYLNMMLDQPGNLMTLSRFMIEATRNNPDHADFESLMISIQLACKTIAKAVAREGIIDLAGVDSISDSKGKHLSQYDYASYVIKNSLRFTGKIGVIEPKKEDDNAVIVEEAWNSRYITVFDPLDGALNIDVGIVTGTIFGVYNEPTECLEDFGEQISDRTAACLLGATQQKNLVAAGYCMYSSSTVLMLTMGEGVNGFTLDPTLGEFVLTHPNVKIPKRGRTYSFNEANQYKWPAALRRYVSDVKQALGEQKLSYTSRYVGSLVGDLHRTLIHGGIFGYPADSKRPRGKLRLLHEVGPLAFLVEQAGGKASTGFGPIREIELKKLDDNVPAFLGSYDDVTEVESYLACDLEP